MKSETDLYKPMFSHIYVEDAALENNTVQQILAKYKSAHIIPIQHYKDVFNKPGQRASSQQKSQKLILACNTGKKVYPGATYCHDFDHRAFFCVSQVLNCPFDCAYCYLKGKYKSANIVVFVNTDDYLADLDKISDAPSPFVTLSYDSDSAALEPLLGLMDPWFDYMRRRPAMIFELRTKSLYKPSCKPLPNLIQAVSVLPQPVIDLYEKGTPSLDARLHSVCTLLDSGFKIRLCLDPLMDIENAYSVYSEFSDLLISKVDLTKLQDISVGCFRMPVTYFKSMCSGYGDHFIHFYPFENREKQVRYNKATEKRLLDYVIRPLKHSADDLKIYTR